MKTIYEMQPLLQRLLPKESPQPGVPYRLITFCMQLETEQGLLLYNTMTREMILLEGEERAAVSERFPKTETALKLVRDFWLVPEEHDDCQLADEVDSFVLKVDNKRIDGKLNSYTILPTTNCNARCYYCYEAGCKHVDMTEEMAHRVADYIERTARTDTVAINWFGGEPLSNTKAICDICNDLVRKGIKYSCHLTTNGYLLDDAVIETAVKLWNLRAVQITLDGTEKVYNAVKAYVGVTDNPFQRVLANIEKLVAAGVFVSIRMNLSDDNYDDLNALADLLKERLPEKGWRMYAHLLFEIEQGHDIERRTRMTELQEKLNWKIMEENPASRSGLKRDIKRWQCQASSGDAIVIDPDGLLYPCEHFNECASCGSIDHDEDKFKNIQKWQKHGYLFESCRSCLMYPICGHIELCPANPTECILAYQNRMIQEQKRIMEFEWDNYRKRQNATSNNI